MNNPNITAGVNIGVGEGKTHTQTTFANDFVACAGRNG